MDLNPSLITEAELQAELAAIVAESIGWLPLGAPEPLAAAEDSGEGSW